MMCKRLKLSYFAFAFVLCCTLSLNCGKKGPLKLEPELLPLAVEEFQLLQAGKDIRLRWVFPEYLSDTQSKTDLDSIARVYVYYAAKDMPAEKFKKKAILLDKFKLTGLTQKDNYYSAAVSFKTNDLDDKFHYFAVLYQYGKKKSPLSKIEVIKTITPVNPIGDLTVIKENKVLKLKWSKPALDIANKNIKSIAGYNVYRKVIGAAAAETEKDFSQLNQAAVLHEYFEDINTGIDGEYLYYVTAVSAKTIESAPSNTAGIKVTDTFPPEPPQNLVVFKHQNHLFLTWEKVEEKDTAYYNVYRYSSADEQDEYRLIAEKVSDGSYKDTQVTRNVSYAYYVTAVDNRGNESKKSNIAREKF